ncbi:acetolactate synthase [Massilibacteroides vaginae]|uniref:acetolactate synthase n=1 Tax=Massilibacteroides vaginae TaxID=1673718 RepID=UPI000A1CEDCA|nr:acetolactate synthase [Massilibacteroides vaginae]
MTINQISIFLENKCGKLSQVLGILTEANIGIIAATVADTSEYGILRLILTDPDKAYALFKENNVTVSKTEVLALATDSCAGSFAKVLGCFTEAGISVEYMYCFSLNGKSILILRTNNSSDAHAVVKKHNLEYISSENLNKI